MASSILNFCRIKFRNLLRPLVIDKAIRFSGVADWFLFSLFVLPSYFGIRLIFFDLTALRFFEILLLIGIFKHGKRRNAFIVLVKKCPNNIFILMYMLVVIYTNLIHFSLNTIFYWITNCLLIIFLIAYLIIYEYGIEDFLEKLKKFAWILVSVSPLEILIGKPPFSFLDTLGKSSTKARFGSVRIMGNCSTTNGYAMFLMILLPLFCYDWKSKRVDLGKNKYLLIMLVLNIFLTGSRLTIGTLIIGLVCCFLLQQPMQIKKEIFLFLISIPTIGVILYVFRETDFIRSILRTFFSAVDEILNTNYAVQFGADAQSLFNSSYYRELLWKNTILGNWLNPWLGRGGDFKFGMFVEGYRIFSIDNFYVGQYVVYAWPGVITWFIMSISFLAQMIKIWMKKNKLGFVLAISFICYYISLWYLDQLQTYSIMAALFGVTYAIRLPCLK